ncbi:MAG TPA: radical SAM protein, partial [Dehalococcoidales bacterium]|nr:radical SAM protein [Dehalococcoidales bacterium]
MTRVAIETLGCKLNQAESESLINQLKQADCRIVSFQEEADIYVVQTCTVTHVADRKCRHLLSLARRLNPQAKLIAIGCYAEDLEKRNEKIKPDLILNNAQKVELLNILRQKEWIKPGKEEKEKAVVNRTRSFIKAQDGCNSRCAYCIVPAVRGPERSLSHREIIAAIRNSMDHGHQEVVLTGTEIGRYKYDRTEIVELVEKILAETAIPRLRLSSLQPAEISPELVALWQ